MGTQERRHDGGMPMTAAKPTDDALRRARELIWDEMGFLRHDKGRRVAEELDRLWAEREALLAKGIRPSWLRKCATLPQSEDDFIPLRVIALLDDRPLTEEEMEYGRRLAERLASARRDDAEERKDGGTDRG